MMFSDKLPGVYGKAVVSNPFPHEEEKERTIEELRAEVERLRQLNSSLESRIHETTPKLDDSNFLPRSPLRSARTPVKPAAPKETQAPRSLQSGESKRTRLNTSVEEHPLTKEYRSIEESELRWVLADQPFISSLKGLKGINMCDDVSEDFFRNLMNQATFNLPKELRQALSMAKETHEKLQSSLALLAASQKTVDESSKEALEDIRHDFQLSRERLQTKQLYFQNEVVQLREDSIRRLDSQLSVISLLMSTLGEYVEQAHGMLERHTVTENATKHRTMADVRNEYLRWRKTIMPTANTKYAAGMVASAAELLDAEKGESVHGIVSALLATLEAAVSRASATEQRLKKHKVDIVQMCEQQLNEMTSDFVMFGDLLGNKEMAMVREAESYKEDTSAKITANAASVTHYATVITDHIDFTHNVLEKGNDYQMFKQTKELKNQLVMMYAELSKLRLQYDGVMFQLASDEFNVPIEQIGTLVNASTRTAVDWSPTANRQRTKLPFSQTNTLSHAEVQQLRELFRQMDSNNSGFIDQSELVAAFRSLWPWATQEELTKIAQRYVSTADGRGIDVEKFLKVVEQDSAVT